MNLLQGLYHVHPINVDIAGTVDTIAEITPGILYECYNSYYNLHNMVLTVVGGADPYEVLKIVESTIKPSAPVKTELIIPDEPYNVVKSYTEQIMPVAVPMFELGFKEDSMGRYATNKEMLCTSVLMNAFIGEGSALYRKLLDEKLINSSFGYEYFEGLGYRCVIMSGETRKPQSAAEMINDAVRKLHKTGISREDFEIAKKVVYGKTISAFDSKQAIAGELISGEFTGRELYEAVEDIAEMTLEDVNKRLESQLDADNCCLSVVKGE